MARRSRLVSLLFLLVVLAAAGATYLRSRSAAPRGVVVERQVSGASPGVAPVPDFLLRHTEELALTPAQQQQIRGLAAAYRRDIAPTEQALATATDRYRTYLQRPPKGARPTPQELSREAGDLPRLSAVAAATRRSYWQQAQQMLSPSQRQIAQRLARRASLRDLT